MERILKFNVLFTTNVCCWRLPLGIRHWFTTEQPLHPEKKASSESLGWFLFTKPDGFQKLFRKWLREVRAKNLMFLFLSLSFHGGVWNSCFGPYGVDIPEGNYIWLCFCSNAFHFVKQTLWSSLLLTSDSDMNNCLIAFQSTQDKDARLKIV